MKFNLETIGELRALIKELANGLLKLNFVDNFESFKATLLIPGSTTDFRVSNQLSFIPSEYIIVSQEGNGLITKAASTVWTRNYLYLDNNSANDVTIKIIFMR